MRKVTLAVLLFLSMLAWAEPDSDAAEYQINVHVSASRMFVEPHSSSYRQKLNVIIDGKKYELDSEHEVNALLALGDYKAKLVRDGRLFRVGLKSDSFRIYEFLLPDGKKRKYIVVGEIE